jgi:hypothetical protein
MPFAAFLMALVAPLARQILVSLGIGLITFVGMDAAIGGALSAAKSSLSGLPAAVTSVLALAGFFTAFSIIAGAMVARVSLMSLKKFGRVTG